MNGANAVIDQRYSLDYVDCECTSDQDKSIKSVSGFMAGRAYNDLCRMLGGRWPDARIEQEAPEAHKFFMAMFDADVKLER